MIAPPEIEITAGQEDGDVEFDAVVEVRPQVQLVGYDELRVELPSPAVDDEAVDRQVDRCATASPTSTTPTTRSSTATTRRSTSRATIDGEAVEGLTATDFLYEVGSGIVVPELDDAAPRQRARATILEFTDDAARALRRARRRRGRRSRCS